MNNEVQQSGYDEDEIDFKKFFILAIDHWYLFVGSVFICLSLSYVFLWYSHPIYEMTATVLAEDEGNDISQNILDEVGVFGKKRNIENEIAILKSRRVMEKSMLALDLSVECEADYGIKSRVLYSNAPLKLHHEVSNERVDQFTFEVSLDESGNEASLYCEYEMPSGDEFEFFQEVELGVPFQNELGSFTILKTSFFPAWAQGDSAASLNYNLNYRSNDVLATNYMELLSVSEARERSSILRLRLEDKVQQRGVDILNTVLDVYIQNNIEKKNQLAFNALKFIDDQLDHISKDLVSLENEIKSFKTTYGVSDISSEATFFLEQVGTLDQTISELDVKLSIINYLESYINSDQDLKNASPSSLGIEDPLLQQLIVKLSELTAERESMLRFTKADNPLVNSIDTKIQETKESLRKNLSSIRNGLLASKQEVENQLNNIEGKVTSLPKAEYELLALQRQYSLKEGLYLLLLEKKSENSIILASTVSDNEILDIARSSDEPIKPKKNLFYLLGLLGGVGIPILYLIILMAIDNRIKDVSELKRLTKIPFLGIIPHYNDDQYLVVTEKTGDSVSEAFRSIRTNLKFVISSLTSEQSDSGKVPKVIQLTSTMGSEGKSFCSINLAASIALGGSRTIVVGLDLRKPKLAEYFGVANDIGASSVLANMVDIKDAIIKSEIENLDVLVAGPIPPNPSELLMSKELSKMLKSLSEDYDHIILDTPPLGLVTDSLIISEHALTSIYVVRQNVTHSDSLQFINEMYSSGKIRSLSILFNDVKASRFGYGGYGYGGYGYGNYSEESKPKSRLQQLFSKN